MSRMFRALYDHVDRLLPGGMDTTDYALHLEREFGMTLPPETESLETLGDLRDLIVEQVRAQGRPADPDDIWERVRRVSSYELGVDESELHPHIRFKEDLLF